MEQAFWTKRWIAWISVYWQWKAIPFFFSLSCLLFLFTDGCYTFFSCLSICSLDTRTFCIFHFGLICRAVVVVCVFFFYFCYWNIYHVSRVLYRNEFHKTKSDSTLMLSSYVIYFTLFFLEYIQAKLRLYINVR